MTRSAQVESQLAAMASAVDRANRPTSLLTVPALVVLVAAVFAVASLRAMNSQRQALRLAQARVAQVASTIEKIRAEERTGFDLESLYSTMPYFGSQVGQDTWLQPDIGFRDTPTITGPATSTAVQSPLIIRQDYTCSVNNEPIEAILTAIDRTLRHEHLQGRVFVSNAMLTPTGSGWRASVRFSLYEKK
jgi:hypothetical protein